MDVSLDRFLLLPNRIPMPGVMMPVILDLAVLVLAGGLIHAHLLLRQPSGEDGRWFSYAAFRNRGFRPFQTGFAAVYPLGVPWVAAQVGRIRPLDTGKRIAVFKICWHVLTGLSVYALALAVYREQSTALVAGLLFGVAVAMPAMDFRSTRLEHFLLLPMNMGLACLVMGMRSADGVWFLGAGALLSWGREVEPRLAPLGLVAMAGSLLSNPAWAGPIFYLGGYLAVALAPPALLTSERMLRPYLRERYVAVWKAGLDRWSLAEVGARLMLQVGPALGQLSAVLMLAAAQVVNFDSWPTLFLFTLIGVLCVLPLFSRDDVAVRMSPLLAPLSILAAHTTAVVAHDGGNLESRAVVAAVVGLAVTQAVVSLNRAYRREGGAQEDAETEFLLEAARILRELAVPGDTLLVWGGNPVLYIHSGLKPFHHEALLAGSDMTDADLKLVLGAMRDAPPHWLLLDNRNARVKWSATDISSATGLPYKAAHRLTRAAKSGGDTQESEIISVYRLDREAWAESLLDHIRIFRLAGDKAAAQKVLERLLTVAPEHHESRLRATLQRSGMALNHSTAQLLAQQAERASGDERKALLFLAGELAESLGMSGAALKFYLGCLKCDVAQPRALTAAASLMRSGRKGLGESDASKESAIAHSYLCRAEKIAPHLPSVQYELALLRLESGCLDEAAERLETVLAYLPEHPGAEPKLRLIRRMQRDAGIARTIATP